MGERGGGWTRSSAGGGPRLSPDNRGVAIRIT